MSRFVEAVKPSEATSPEPTDLNELIAEQIDDRIDLLRRTISSDCDAPGYRWSDLGTYIEVFFCGTVFGAASLATIALGVYLTIYVLPALYNLLSGLPKPG